MPGISLKRITSGRKLTKPLDIDFEYREVAKRGYTETIDGNIYKYNGNSIGETGWL